VATGEKPAEFVPAAAGDSLAPASVVLGGPMHVEYQAMGEEAGTLDVLRRDETGAPSDPRRSSVTCTMQMENHPAQERTLTQVVLPDGSLATLREVNRADRVIVDFDPPLVVYPAHLAAGEALEQKFRMIVHPIKDETKVQQQGDAKQTIRYEGHERIQTPLGVLDSFKMVATLEADLGGPQVLNETQEWLAPGIGVVASKEKERTTLLGVRVRANDRWWVVKKVD
jgi:hypothetical protein